MTAPTNVTFTSGTTITSEWLNGVNDYVNELNPADHSAANVTYDPPFTNAVATNVEDKLAQYVSVKDFGAVGDGVTDDTAAIQNAIDAAYTVSFGANETYLISDTITCDHNIIIEGNGATITSTDPDGYLNFYGSIGTPIAVTATIAAGQKTITATNTFAANDLVIIRDNTDYSFSAHRAYYKRGEAHKVQTATGSNFTIPAAIWSYSSTTNLSVVKVTPITVVVNDLSITNLVATSHVFRVQFGEQNYFRNLKITGGTNSAFLLDRCYFSTAVECEFRNISDVGAGNNYGISIASSHYTTVKNSITHGTRHAVGLGGANDVGDVPCYRTDIDGCTLTNDTSVGLYVADIHGNAANTTYRNNTIYGAICIGGENAYYLNNDIHSTADLPPVQMVEVVGGEFIIDSNTIDTYGWPTVSTYDYVVGFTSSSQSAATSFDYNMTFSNNTLNLTGQVEQIVRVFINNASATWNLTMFNTTYRNYCAGLTSIIYYYNSSGKVARWMKLLDFNTHSTMTVGNIKLFELASGSATGCKLTLPASDHTVSLTTASGDAYKTALLTYNYNYGTYAPRLTAEVQNNAIVSSGYVFSTVGSVTAINATVGITTYNASATFGTAATYTVNARTSIADYLIP